jgi:hypothetical protein
MNCCAEDTAHLATCGHAAVRKGEIRVRLERIKARCPRVVLPEPVAPSLCYGSATSRGLTMNRNVTIGLGTLIVIIIIVALLF